MKRILPVHSGLPRTGATTVQRTGDDGTFQAGARVANTRLLELVINGDGTVTDLATGLMWVRQPEILIPGAVGVHATNQVQVAHGNWANNHPYTKADLCKDTADTTYWVCAVAHTSAAAGTFAADRAANPTYWRQTVWTGSAANLTTPALVAWNDAVDQCQALVYAGYDDWRLPNAKELLSLMGFGNANYLSQTIFPNCLNVPYNWSSSTVPSNLTYAIYAQYGGTNTPLPIYLKTTADIPARAVRGGIVKET